MDIFPEYEQYDAIGLAGLVRNGEISPHDLLEASINRIQARNPKVNAVVHTIYDFARKQIKEPLGDGPFAGVPFLLKDLDQALAGTPLSNGSRSCQNYIPTENSTLINRFLKAGFMMVGRTNVPEFGLMGITEPDLYGPTRNPWDLNHTSGGSSGGAAAAIASGMVPVAHGGDGGGSIRIPASCCGLFGLKPSRGRVPAGPFSAEAWQGAAVNGVLSRSVRDSAAILDIIAGPSSGDPFIIPQPNTSWLEASKSCRKLNIGYCFDSPMGTPVHDDCIKAVQNTIEKLRDLGHQVVEASPSYDGEKLAEAYINLYFGEVAADIRTIGERLGRKLRPKDVEPGTWTLGLLGRTLSAENFVTARRIPNLAARAFGRFFQNYDLLLTPTLAHPPVPVGTMKPKGMEITALQIINHLGLGRLVLSSGLLAKVFKRNLEKMPFTLVANLTGLPAMSVPLYRNDAGLPIGSHFIAPFGDEASLFSLAQQLEEQESWFESSVNLGL